MEKLSLNIECKHYEAFMSRKMCESMKEKAVKSNGEFRRKCLDCTGPIPNEIEEIDGVTERLDRIRKEAEMEKGLSLKCKVCGRTVEASEKFFSKSQECKRCYDKRWKREHKKQEQAETQTRNTTSDTPVTPAKAALAPLKAEKPKSNGNGHILLLDFKDYPDWYEKLKVNAEKELRTPANMVMYWIKDYVTNLKGEGSRNA